MKVEIEFFEDGASVTFENKGNNTVLKYLKEDGKYPFDMITDRVNEYLKNNVKTEQKF